MVSRNGMLFGFVEAFGPVWVQVSPLSTQAGS